MIRAAFYARVSSDQQAAAHTIESQLSALSERAQADGFPVPPERQFLDDGYTGATLIRPAMDRLRDLVALGGIDRIYVHSPDRLARKYAYQVLLIDEWRRAGVAVAELEKDGVRVKSMTEEFDTATPTGRLMLTMLSGFAAHERDVIRERSISGTNRLAEAGVWLGGIVPYGYRRVGEKSQRRIVISEDPIPRLQMSEAEVVRIIYRMCAVEKKSCQKISEYLNRTGVPCRSADPARATGVGKRNRRTAPIWRPSHVGYLITSQTYMGKHIFGKRAKNPNRKPIIRAAPAIVSEETWKAAQEVLKSNRYMSPRNTRRSYLLRGLIKCGVCGLTFCGVTMNSGPYYRCNGRQFARGVYGATGQRCPSKLINGSYVEQRVWADIETFLRNPGEILEWLRQRLQLDGEEQQRRERDLERLRGLLEQKSEERDRILGLFRRGRIDETTLDKQMDEIEKESAGLRAEIEAESRVLSSGDQREQLKSAEALLAALRKRLDKPISPELKRRIVETLVDNVRVDTVERWGVEQSQITVTYRFAQPDEIAPALLPLSHHLMNRMSVPEKLETVGDHLRRRRLVSKLLQRQVAEQLGVDQDTVRNWEANRVQPQFRFMPAIIRFLGYNPSSPPPKKGSLGERLVSCRKLMGISQKDLAGQLAVDPCTLARWERGEREPTGKFAARALRFLDASEIAWASTTALTA
jgi:site-specific DNA recombinase